MTVVPELEDIYNRYKKNKQSREYGRFVNFSELLRKCPNYQKNIPLYDQWKRSTKLKNVEIHKVIEYFSGLGLPKQPDCSKRFGECQRLWIAAFWPIYGQILESCHHYVCNGSEITSTLIVTIPERIRCYIEAQYNVTLKSEHIIDTKRENHQVQLSSTANGNILQIKSITTAKKPQRIKNSRIQYYPQKIRNNFPVESRQVQHTPSESKMPAQYIEVYYPQRYLTERSQVVSSPYSQIVAGPMFWI